MSLKDQLFEAAKPFLKEGIESSKEIIANNSTSFDEMGMANSNPGEFAPEEITDQENLVNTAKMSNDTDFSNKVNDENGVEISAEIEVIKPLEDLVNLGNGEMHDCDDEKDCCKHRHCDHSLEDHIKFHKIADMLESARDEYLKSLKESDYAGNLSYNPDKRLNASDVLNAVKNAVDSELAAKLSVVKNIDANEEPSYAIQNIDEKDLPTTLEIDTNTDKKIVLKKDGNSYKFDK